MGLPIRIETRTGDTPVAQRAAPARAPPDILLTTPEQLALLLSHPDCARICSPTSTPSSSTSCMRWPPPSAAICWRSTWRGCARWRRACVTHRSVGNGGAPVRAARLSRAAARRQPAHRAGRPRAHRAAAPSRRSTILEIDEPVPWSGHTTLYAMRRDLRRDRGAPAEPACSSTRACRRSCCSRSCGASTTSSCRSRCTTARSTPRSAARSRRRWPPARCKAVVATSTLDLGIDWGDVDLVIHVGAPKGASRFIQRIGRSNHRLDEPSQAHPGAVEPLRGAGVPRGASMRPRPARRTRCCRAGRARRAGPARARHGVRRRRSIPMRSTPRCARPRPTPA